MEDESLEILKEIRDEAKHSNARLESLEGRVVSLEVRVSEGFAQFSADLKTYVERLDLLSRRQTDSELRLATEVLDLADVNRQIRDLLVTKLDDHKMVINHEERIRSIEDRINDRE